MVESWGLGRLWFERLDQAADVQLDLDGLTGELQCFRGRFANRRIISCSPTFPVAQCRGQGQHPRGRPLPIHKVVVLDVDQYQGALGHVVLS